MNEKIINIGLTAHVDAGKTTLTEQLLYQSGVLRERGSVDSGTAQTDSLRVERERGISVKAAGAFLKWKNVSVNIIDTPGHSDFISEVERSLCVLDAAVLIVSAVEGVQAQTEVLVKAFDVLKIPCIVFINKLDRVGSSYESCFDELKELFAGIGRDLLALNEPVGEESERATVRNYSVRQSDFAERAVLAAGDEELIDAYLSTGTLESETLERALTVAVNSCRAVPVLCGVSKTGEGAAELLDCVIRFIEPKEPLGEELFGRVYKVEHDKTMGKTAHVRIFSGSVKNRDEVYIPRCDKSEKVTQIRLVSGRKQQDAGEIGAGGCAALCGLTSIRAGDIIGRGGLNEKNFSMTVPLLTVRIVPDNEDKITQLVVALDELCSEDPLLDFEWIKEKRELHVKITGSIQLEVLQALLRDRYNLNVAFSDASVIYKETPTTVGEGFEAYTMPKPCWAVVKFLIEPLPRGSGLQYESRVSDKKILYRYQNHVETAVPRALKQGLLGWETTDLKVTLIDGEHHNIHTHPLDFFVATPMAIMNGLENTGTTLLEPILKVRLCADEESLGRTIGMLVGARGSFDSPVTARGKFTVEALVPAAESLEMPAVFSSLTGGRGSYGAVFSHYEKCPEGFVASAERRGIDPRDRSRFILHARQAL